jgi:hypothetical protein
MTAHLSGQAVPSAARQMRTSRVALAATSIVALCVAAMLGVRPTLAAPANQLSNANVTPGSGTTNTSFTFAVTYRSAQGNEPTSVSAVAGSVVIPLSLVSGMPSDGRYRGSAKLPQGSWPVSYLATARGNDPSLNGPTVTVTRAPPPSPTPRPTPRPTPKPSPRPTPSPTAAPTRAPSPKPAPSKAPHTTSPHTPHPVSQKPRKSPLATPSPTPTGGTAGGILTPSPTPGDRPGLGGAAVGPSPLVTILVGTLVALLVLGAIGLFAFVGARRRRRPETRLELLPEEARELPPARAQPATPKVRKDSSWERDWALDDAPIGSVEYRPPPEPLPEDEGA